MYLMQLLLDSDWLQCLQSLPYPWGPINTAVAMWSMPALFAWCKLLTCRASLIGLSLVLHDAPCTWHAIVVHLPEQAALDWFMPELSVIRFRHGLKCMPTGHMQHDAIVAFACVQHVILQHAMSQMFCTVLNAERPLDYWSFFTADVYSCGRYKVILPSQALCTTSAFQMTTSWCLDAYSSEHLVFRVHNAPVLFCILAKHLYDKLQPLSWWQNLLCICFVLGIAVYAMIHCTLSGRSAYVTSVLLSY